MIPNMLEYTFCWYMCDYYYKMLLSYVNHSQHLQLRHIIYESVSGGGAGNGKTTLFTINCIISECTCLNWIHFKT